MVARVARFEGVNAQEVERSYEQLQAVIRPLVDPLEGYRGHIELMSPGGDFLSMTFFESEEAATEAESTFDEEMPRRLGELFRSWEGRRVSVTRYRVLGEDRP